MRQGASAYLFRIVTLFFMSNCGDNNAIVDCPELVQHQKRLLSKANNFLPQGPVIQHWTAKQRLLSDAVNAIGYQSCNPNSKVGVTCLVEISDDPDVLDGAPRIGYLRHGGRSPRPEAIHCRMSS